ncbi:MAG: TonB-dependent receptor [Pseudomonadota bacterium]
MARNIVSGQKIDRSLQDTAASVRVYGQEAIEKQNFINLYDILDQTANVSTGFNDESFTIRGVRNRGAGLGDTTSDVSTIYIDGVFLPSSLFQNGALNLWDIESVEVFRGPQSTIQGRNALAGAIVVSTIDPSTIDVGYRAQVSYADYDTARLSASISTPVVDNQIGLSLSIDYAETDGFTFNPTFSNSESAASEVSTFRAKSLITPETIPNLSIALGYTHIGDISSENRIEEDFFPEERINAENLQTFVDVVADIASVELNYDIGDNWTVTSVSGYIDTETDQFNDATRDETGGDASSSFLTTEEIFSQELRASFEGKRVTGLLGAYYFNRSGESGGPTSTFTGTDFAFPDPATFAGILFGTPTPDAIQIATADGLRTQIIGLIPEFEVRFVRESDIDIENYALFGEATIDVTDKLALTLGARYDEETIKQNVFDETFVPPLPSTGDATIDGIISSVAAQFSDQVQVDNVDNTFTAFLPKAQVTYDWADNVSTSFTYQKAYRAGGVSINTFRAALADPDAGQSDLESLGIVGSFDPEFTNNYELAFRSQWFDDRLTVNANAFFIDYTDQQITVQLSDNPLDTLTDNAAGSESATPLRLIINRNSPDKGRFR